MVTPSLDDISSFDLTTQRFVGVDTAEEPVLLTKFFANGTFEDDFVDLYPDKLKNLEGREFNVSTITYVPYVITETVVKFQDKCFIPFNV